MKQSRLRKSARQVLNAMHLADKCLLVVMTILMVQSAHNLFFHELAVQESNVIDVVVRTTAAAIFGYFISANFLGGGRDASEDPPTSAVGLIAEATSHELGRAKASIGFSASAEKPELQHGAALPSCENQAEQRDRLQILVVAAIGILALLLLLIARDFLSTNQTSIATLSQLRDFVSGSVGFLLGHSTRQAKPS